MPFLAAVFTRTTQRVPLCMIHTTVEQKQSVCDTSGFRLFAFYSYSMQTVPEV